MLPGQPFPAGAGRARRWAHYDRADGICASATTPMSARDAQQSDQPENALWPWPRHAPRSPITAPAATAGRPTPGSPQITGLSVRTVQRASTALRLLGVATEVMRGRQRTRAERFASWRVGDKGRGWASVWALHDCRIQSLSPHPGGSQLDPSKPPSKAVLTTASRRQAAGSSAAPRRPSPEIRAHGAGKQVGSRPAKPAVGPAVSHRHPVGAGPGRAGPTRLDAARRQHPDPRLDGHRALGAREARTSPSGCSARYWPRTATSTTARRLTRWHVSAKSSSGLATRIAAQLAARDANQQAREAGRAALSGPGREAARKALHDIAERARRRRHDNPDADGSR